MRSTSPPLAITSPPKDAAAALSGCPSSAAAMPNVVWASLRYPRSARASATPATAAAALEPRPLARGIRLTPWRRWAGIESSPFDAANRMARLTKSVPSVGSSSAPSPSQTTPRSASVSITTSLHRSSARPKQSNPGPRFADVAGTRAVSRMPATLQAELRRDGVRVGGDGRRMGRAGDRPLRVLQTVTGQDAPDRRPLGDTILSSDPKQSRNARGRRRLREHPFSCDAPVCGEDLAVGDGEDRALGLLCRRERLIPRRRVPDSDRRRDRLGRFHRCTFDDWSSPRRLEPEQPWRLVDHAVVQVLGVAEPVAPDVPGVAHGNAVHIRRAAERIADLERRGLLPLQAVRGYRVHQRPPESWRQGLCGPGRRV